MYKKILLLTLLFTTFSTGLGFAASATQTHRIPQFSNKKVTVWETIIYPSETQKLSMHRHDNDRVLIALTDGVLKIKTDKGETKLMQLSKDKAYFLSAEPQGVLHTDENVGKQPIKVIVVNLN